MLTNPGTHYINDGNLFKCKHCSGYNRYTYLCISIVLFIFIKYNLSAVAAAESGQDGPWGSPPGVSTSHTLTSHAGWHD